jgi:DNA-directed RNA polymerase specialized sigma24 family protein
MKTINMNSNIKSYEPMMHKLIRKFKIKRDYEDILQLLRIKTWEVLRDKKYKKAYKNEKGQIVEAKLSTLLYRALTNKLIDILKTDYSLKIKDDGTTWKDLNIDKKIIYFLKNPTLCGLPFLQIENYDMEDSLKSQLDFEQFYKLLSKEDKLLLDAMKNNEGNKKEVAKFLDCNIRSVNRRLLKLKKEYKKYLMGDI